MSVDKLLISGARLRPGGFELGDGKFYDKAILLELDTRTGEFTERVSITEGGSNYPDEHPNLQFTAGCLEDDQLWLPTDTEIRRYTLPAFKLTDVISYPCFQNIHSVHKFDDALVATSTGLDNIVFLDAESGEIRNIVNADGKDPWHRFDRDTDYRKIHSTRPHECHPNFVFKFDNSLWVTRCKQEDAINLSNTSELIDISLGDTISIHDGLLWRDKIVFTRVDSLIVTIDAATRQFEENINPFGKPSARPMSWSRGLHIDGDIFYIGYSKLRKTRLKEKIKFLASGEFKDRTGGNAFIAAYDMSKKELVNIYKTPSGLIDAIYGILPFEF